MNRKDFAEVMARLAAGYGTGFGRPMDEFMVNVYFDALGDLNLEVLRIAAKRVLVQQKWFPTVHELREAAAETMAGQVKDLPAAEAWKLAWRAAGRIDPDVNDSMIAALAGLNPLVIETMKTFGIHALCYGKEPVGVVRVQFMKIYEQLQARDRREKLLPPALKEEVKAIGQASLRERMKLIGVEK